MLQGSGWQKYGFPGVARRAMTRLPSSRDPKSFAPVLSVADPLLQDYEFAMNFFFRRRLTEEKVQELLDRVRLSDALSFNHQLLHVIRLGPSRS